jgi:hypothetical protein
MSDDGKTITSVPEAVSSIVTKLVENEGANFPFLVAAVGLNGSIWYGRVDLIDAERGDCCTIAEKLVEDDFTFPSKSCASTARARATSPCSMRRARRLSTRTRVAGSERNRVGKAFADRLRQDFLVLFSYANPT